MAASSSPSTPPGTAARSAPAGPSVRGTCTAPSPVTNASSSAPATAYTDSPLWTASSTANPPTAPAAPVTARDRPGARPSASSACAAVNPPSGRVAASSAVRPGGAGAIAAASSTTYSAWVPVNVSNQSDSPMTASPSMQPATLGPTASTTPARSQPSAWYGRCGSRAASAPDRVARSTGWTAVACTRMRTCPGPGSGTGRSATRSTSGTTSARIGSPSVSATTGPRAYARLSSPLRCRRLPRTAPQRGAHRTGQGGTIPYALRKDDTL